MEQLLGPELSAFAVNVLRVSIWFAILTAIFVPLERLFAAHPYKVFRKEFATDVGYYFLNSLLTVTLLSVPAALLGWVVRHAIPSSFLTITAAWPFGVRVFVGTIAGDFGYYWGHRLSHEIPFLWRFHSIHHSAEELDYLVNTRSHPVDLVFSRLAGFIPIYILGFGGPGTAAGSQVAILAGLFGIVWGFFIHANLRWRLGPLEWLISTPAYHHWHHTKSGPINRNYSATFPWLDRVFGTLYLPKELPSDYGIQSKVPDNLVDQLAFPLMPQAATLERSEALSVESVDPS